MVVYIVDGMDVKRKAAIPMSATPTPGVLSKQWQGVIYANLLPWHIYIDKTLWLPGPSWPLVLEAGVPVNHPGNLKPTTDLELANGFNRFDLHTSVDQPVDDKIPGLGLGLFGQWFNRHETWANQAKAWTDYLARSYMLQQGKFVADVVYYYGEDNNITALFGGKLPDVPAGYNYDFINPDALINLLSVKDGMLITPSGMSYRGLALDSNASKMSLPVLRKIKQLVKAGAIITGVKPEMNASLKDDKQEFQRLVDEVWNAGNTKVTTGKSLNDVFSSLNIQPDFSYTKPQQNTKLCMFTANCLVVISIG